MAFAELKAAAERDVGQRALRARHQHAPRLHELVIDAGRSEAGRATARRGHGNGRRRDPRSRSAVPTSSAWTSLRCSSTRRASERRRKASTVQFDVGDAEAMDYEDASFDVVVSTCGVMFAPDHAAVARELARVTKPGGRLALACWTPEGGLGQMFGMMRPFLPPPARRRRQSLHLGHGGSRPRAPRRAFELQFEEHDSILRTADGEEYWELFSTLVRPDEERRRGTRRRAPRGVPPDLGRLLRAAARGRRGRAPPRVAAHARHASLSHSTRDASNVPAMPDAVTMDKIVSLARRRGFVFPSSEIYGGLGSSYDYGHYGVLLKDNVKARWFEAMVRERDDIVALDSSIILHPAVWEASGHVAGFADPLVDCRFCKRRYRADQLDQAQCGQKPSKHPGETEQCDLTEPRQFNLMFETTDRPGRGDGAGRLPAPGDRAGHLRQLQERRPDRAAQAAVRHRADRQGVPQRDHARELHLPHPRVRADGDGVLRPARGGPGVVPLLGRRSALAWHRRYGLRESHLRVRAHDAEELSHYSSATSDIEYLFPIGWSELEGIAHRGDFDLTAHTQASGTKLEWVDGDERYTPACRRAGARRQPLDARVHGRRVRRGGRGRARAHGAPPPPRARAGQGRGAPARFHGTRTWSRRRASLYEELRRAVVAEYDDSGQIGRRYRRQDEIGTPYALTIDEQTLEDDTVTIRDRDSLAQERIPICGARGVRARQARRRLDDAEERTSELARARAARSLGSTKPNLR